MVHTEQADASTTAKRSRPVEATAGPCCDIGEVSSRQTWVCSDRSGIAHRSSEGMFMFDVAVRSVRRSRDAGASYCTTFE